MSPGSRAVWGTPIPVLPILNSAMGLRVPRPCRRPRRAVPRNAGRVRRRPRGGRRPGAEARLRPGAPRDPPPVRSGPRRSGRRTRGRPDRRWCPGTRSPPRRAPRRNRGARPGCDGAQRPWARVIQCPKRIGMPGADNPRGRMPTSGDRLGAGPRERPGVRTHSCGCPGCPSTASIPGCAFRVGSPRSGDRPSQSGMLPCFLAGRLCRLFRSEWRARMSFGRVSRGSITSSR